MVLALLAVLSVSLGQAQTTLSTATGSTNYTGANGVTGAAAVTFAVQNTNAFPVTLTNVSVVLNSATVSSGAVCNLWVTSTCLSGATTTAAGCTAGGISSPTWTNIATSAAIPVAGGATLYNVFPGLSYNIPASTTLRFAVQSSAGITYSGAAGPPTPSIFSGGGVNLLSGGAQISALNVGYGGAFPAPANNPRWFTGSITFAPTIPCSGTPNPGNTTASVTAACTGANFSLGLQNSTTGTGVSYAWEFDNGGGWTPFGTNAPTQSVSQSVATSYRCTVDCPAGGGTPTSATSTPIAVGMSSLLPVDFASATFPSNCWSLSTTNNRLLRDAANAYGAAGTGSAKWDFFNATSGTEHTITSPTLTPAPASYQIRFDAAGTTYTGGEIDHVFLETSTTGPAGPWTTVADMTNATGGVLNTTAPQTASFTPTAAQWTTLTYPVATGTNAVRFRGVSNFGNGVFIDNIALEPVPTCFLPTGITVVGSSTTSAQVSFTPNGSASYIIEYGPPGFTPGTQGTPGVGGTIITTTTSPVTIPGLVHPNQYNAYVRSVCTPGVDYSANSSVRTFYPQPPYDACQSITTFPTVAPGGTILLTGNNFGATDSEGFGANVSWEAFTLTSCATTLNIDYCGSTPARTNAFVNLFVGCPQSAGFIPWTGTAGPACPNGSVNVPYANVPAGTYYIAIMNQAGAQGPYGINVTAGAACPPPPANDVCSTAVPIACGDVLTGTTVNATSTGAPATLCNGFLNNNSGGVWYVASNLCGSVTASLCTTTPSWDSKLAVYSGSCGSLVCVTTDDDFCAPLSQATWTASASETYYIYVLDFTNNTSSAFTLGLTCTNSPIAATATATDNCIGGTFDVAVDVTSLGGSPTTINWVATPGGPGSMSAALGTNNIPVSFATGTQVSVTLSNGVSGCDLNLGNFYSNCPVNLVCGTAENVTHCYTNNDPRTFTFHTPTLGETVTVTFIAGSMDANDVIRAYEGTDNLGAPIPTLTGTFANLFGVSGTSAGQDLFIEIDSDGSNSCFTGQQSTWVFQAECTPGCVDPDGSVSENITCGTYSYTLDVQVTFMGDGASVDLEYTVGGVPQTPITGLTDASPIQTLGPFPIGTSVSVVLAHETDGACDKNLGTFTGTSTFCPPPGWTCALPLDVNSFPYSHTNTTCGAGNDLIGTQCGLGANYGGGEDFIYRLNVGTAGDYLISAQLTGGNSFAGWFLKSSSNCSVASACLANAVTTTANGTASSVVTLAAGTYYLIVDSRPLPNCVGYVLNITPFTPISGDNCSIAIPLTPALTCTPLTSSNVGATQSIAAITCAGFTSASALDMWYSFVATSASHSVIVTGAGAFDAVVDVRSGACNGSNIGCADASVGGGTEVVTLAGLTVGQTYYVRVYGWAGGTGVYDICVTAAFDPCASVANITACDVATGDVNVAAGAGAFDNYGGPFSTPGQEAIFTFTPTVSGTHEIVVNNLVGSWIDFFFKAVGTCDATGWNFIDDVIGTGTVIPSGTPLTLTAGTQYYIMWDPEDTDARTVDFEITCPPPPPANDDCANAITLTPGLTCTTTTGTTVGATESIAASTCSGFTSTVANDVWYSFVATSTTHRASAQGTGGFDGIIEMFSGPCNGTSLGCSDNTVGNGLEQIEVTTLTVGQTYFVRVYGWAGINGTFDICVETPDCLGVYGGTALPGTSCDDGNASTVLDVYGANCVCAGTTCTTDLKMAFQLDGSSNVSWELRQQGTGILVQSGTAFAGPTSLDQLTCLPNGCFYLRVIDDGGDGITGGGYILTNNATGTRIIDNRNNFTSGTVSAIAANEGFCLPLGIDRLILASCDKLDWRNNEYVIANDNPAVTAVWNSFPSGSPQRATSGYEMWWFDPNGGYSFRRFQSHATTNGIAASATRACNFKINNWSGNQLQNNVLYNVKVRSRVIGVNSEWGSACRFTVDPVRAQCPLTKLFDTPSSQFFSCNSSRSWGAGNYVHAKPVTRLNNSGGTVNANKYQFRFRIPAENFEVIRTSATGQYFVQLNWTTLPLEPGKTYFVDVRASFDNGATWCTDFIAPALTDPWGEVCRLTIASSLQGGGQNMVLENTNNLRMYPNPNRGDQLYLSLDAVKEGVNTVSVDIFDLYGKRVSARTIPVQDGFVNTVLDLKGSLAAGMYMVNITAGDKTYTERLVIQP